MDTPHDNAESILNPIMETMERECSALDCGYPDGACCGAWLRNTARTQRNAERMERARNGGGPILTDIVRHRVLSDVVRHGVQILGPQQVQA